MQTWPIPAPIPSSKALYPKLSIILSTLNSAAALPLTLDSLSLQDYPDFEVVVVDGGSKDRTLQVVKRYPHVRIYTVREFGKYERINWGISHAKGLYLQFLFPGDCYLNYQALRIMIDLALSHNTPHLLYSGCMLHKADRDDMLNRCFSSSLLKSGRQPTSLQSCWFHVEVFKEIGLFPTHYKIRGEFDLLCRYYLSGKLRSINSTRILLDCDLRNDSQQRILYHFWETGDILLKRFGLITCIKWLIFQQDIWRYFLFLFRCVKKAFLGRV